MWKIVWLVVAGWASGCVFDEGGLDLGDPEASRPVHPGGLDQPLPPEAPPAVNAYCPDGAWFDHDLGMCVDPYQAFGPFTAVMSQGCLARGGGAACTDEVPVEIAGHAVYLQRWERTMAAGLRGDGHCMNGAAPDPALDHRCVERAFEAGDWADYAYGPFDADLVAVCLELDHGDTCWLQRWPRGLVLEALAAR